MAADSTWPEQPKCLMSRAVGTSCVGGSKAAHVSGATHTAAGVAN